MGRRAKAPPQRARRPVRGAGRRRSSKGEYKVEDSEQLDLQLRPLGLAVRLMDTDGNCLFRAVADQHCGDCEEHAVYRQDCCDFMLEHAEDLRLFHADEDFEDEEESFEAYVEHMRSPARWGSQLELMALCRKHEVNAIVHQHGMPAYEMVFAPPEARCVQVSYHDGEHYNSVRFATDMEPGRPARFLSLREVRGQAERREDVRRVGEGLPQGLAAPAAEILAALAEVRGQSPGVDEEALAAAAVELLVARGAGALAPSGLGQRPSAADAQPEAAPAEGEAATEAEPRAGAPPGVRRGGRWAERPRAREVKDRARRERRRGGPAVASSRGAGDEVGKEAAEPAEGLALLSEQLLTV